MAWLTETKRLNKATGRKETYYALQFRDEAGKQRTKALGFIPSSEAKQMLKIAEGKLASGQPMAPPPTATGSAAPAESAKAQTLAGYLDEVYLPVVRRDKAPKTAVSAATAANALKRVLGDLALTEITYASADGYVTARRAQGRKGRTIIIELWVLRGCLQHAFDSGHVPAVPKMPRVSERDRAPHKYLTPDETRALLAALKPPATQPEVTRGRPPLQYDWWSYLAILMALNTGARKGEVLTRGWEDVRWDQGPHGLLIVGAKPEIGFRIKTGRDRAVPLTPELRAALDEAHARAGKPPRGWIFRAREGDVPRDDFKTALHGACRRAGLPPLHPHGLRHTWATRLAMAGVDRRTLMEIGGWTDGRMLDEVYAHATDSHKVEVMSKMGIAPAPVPDSLADPSKGSRPPLS